MKKILLFSMIAVPVFFLSVSPSFVVEPKQAAIDPNQILEQAASVLREGDIVVRMNKDPMSHYIRNFNTVDKRYSHAGIVLLRKGKPFVFHIINGPENPGGMIKSDLLSEFCSPRKNTAWGIYRYQLTASEIKNLHLLMDEWIKKKIIFDQRFDLDTDEAMYCSEMISKLLSNATSQRIRIHTRKPGRIEALCLASYAALPVKHTMKIRMIAIEDLYLQPSCSLIKEFNRHN